MPVTLGLALSGVMVLVGTVGVVLGVRAHVGSRSQRAVPVPPPTPAQRRLAATHAWERGDPEVTMVIPVERGAS